MRRVRSSFITPREVSPSPRRSRNQAAANHSSRAGFGPQWAQERAEILEVRGDIESIGIAAGAPADVAAHRLIGPELPAQSVEMRYLGHVHASCAGTLPMEPAPIVTTTSPSRATRRMA